MVDQPFVKDPDMTVEKFVASKGATVKSFVRFEVGEGIEKREDNFVEEVMSQVKKIILFLEQMGTHMEVRSLFKQNRFSKKLHKFKQNGANMLQ